MRSASATANPIGGALFEVTQPRMTCYRVGIRMDEPRMAALLGRFANSPITRVPKEFDFENPTITSAVSLHGSIS
jgi:hypothetical protein